MFGHAETHGGNDNASTVVSHGFHGMMWMAEVDATPPQLVGRQASGVGPTCGCAPSYKYPKKNPTLFCVSRSLVLYVDPCSPLPQAGVECGSFDETALHDSFVTGQRIYSTFIVLGGKTSHKPRHPKGTKMSEPLFVQRVMYSTVHYGTSVVHMDRRTTGASMCTFCSRSPEDH